MLRIKATIRDSTSKDPKPTLDLYFPREVAARHRWEHKQPIEIILDEGAPWRGTIGLKPSHPPYLHRPVERSGEKMSMREWLLHQGLAPGAVVELMEESGDRFRWIGVLEQGRWPSGRAPHERQPLR